MSEFCSGTSKRRKQWPRLRRHRSVNNRRTRRPIWPILETCVATLRRFVSRVKLANVSDNYELAHAQLALEVLETIHARRASLGAGKLKRQRLLPFLLARDRAAGRQDRFREIRQVARPRTPRRTKARVPCHVYRLRRIHGRTRVAEGAGMQKRRVHVWRPQALGARL